MYYKISLNDEAIDVFEKIEYCKYDDKIDMILRCDRADANGLTSARTGNNYHISGYPKFPDEYGYATVSLEEINYEEYTQLLELLDEKGSSIKEILKSLKRNSNDISELEAAILELAEIIGG